VWGMRRLSLILLVPLLLLLLLLLLPGDHDSI
jgi:hypothetical protein